MAPTFNFHLPNGEAKLRELILYIANKAPDFGAVKLNKTLVFSDFIAFYRFGVPITGVEYMRLPEGPVPRRMLPVLAELKAAGDLVTKEVTEGKYTEAVVHPASAGESRPLQGRRNRGRGRGCRGSKAAHSQSGQ